MSARFTPGVLLSVAVSLSVILAALMLGLAMDQRWLGIALSPQQELDLVWIERVDAQGPSRDVAAPGVLVAITGRGGERITIEPQDLIEEPDTLPSYAAMHAFFARQEAIAAALARRPVLLETEFLSAPRQSEVRPQSQRPVTSLPLAFWIQIGVGLAGFWIGAWVWALRRGEWAPRCLALAGTGLMISAFPAAVYSTREIAIPGGLFRILSAFNSIGALVFGMGMIGLFMIYPRRLVSARWLLAPAAVLGAWQAVDLLELVEGPDTGRHLPIVLAMLAIIALVGIQLRATRGHPRDRAALAWLGLAVILGAGAFVITVIAPVVLGIGAVMSQGYAFLFFLLIYAGVALGVARFRLFQLDEWAFRVFFYVIGVLLLLVLDAILILTVIDERAPAFALSLLIVALVWLPMRDMLARLVLRRVEPSRGNLFRAVMDVALTPPGRDQQARWRALLENTFRPLSIAPWPSDAPGLIDDGLALAVPGPRGLPDYRLDYAGSGRKLFSPRDVELAAELGAMLRNALESREAYETGVAVERERIARDIHDNIGVQLMGALHSRGLARKDMMIRETLSDLRDIINNASNPDLSFDEMLADLRSQIAEHLFAAGVTMKWEVETSGAAVLPLAAAHTTRSVIREAVQNALRHGQPGMIRVAVRLDGQDITLSVSDDGQGFDPETVQAGNGLSNMQARVTALGGTFTLASGTGGTAIQASFPVDTGRSRRE